MNKYGATARAHWQKHLPTQFAAMQDSESYFSSLGEEIESRVDELSQVIAGEDPPNESYLEKAGRLQEAQQAAESTALREFLPEPESD